VPAGKSQQFAASLQRAAAAAEGRFPHMIIARSLVLVIVLSASVAARASEANVPRPEIPQRTFPITDFGAVGDGATLNTDAIVKTIAACKQAGGGIVVVPAGKFLTGPFDLASRMNLQIDEGATIVLTDSPDAFLIAGNRHRHGISADGSTDLAITGKGTIDGQGAKWWEAFRKIKGTADEKKHPRRPNLVDLNKCRRVLVQDVLLTNSPNFHLVPRDCDDVTIEGIRIIAPEDAPNTDGIDPSGHNYLITRCTFDVGDDCIAIKPQRISNEAGKLSCEDFVITDCTFKAGHGLSIGGQTPGGMRRLTVRNCTFDGTDAGIRMKAPRGEGGLVEDLSYDRLTMKNVKVPIFITSYYPNNTTPKDPSKDAPQPVTKTTPIWRNIRISNVTVTDCPEAGRIFGLPESPIENLTLTNVKISAEKGLQIMNARNVTFVDSQIVAKSGKPLIIGAAEVNGFADAQPK
jgi:polygalacturonase